MSDTNPYRAPGDVSQTARKPLTWKRRISSLMLLIAAVICAMYAAASGLVAFVVPEPTRRVAAEAAIAAAVLFCVALVCLIGAIWLRRRA